MKEILFGTDIRIFNYFYNICKAIGDYFYIGIEGGVFILFGSISAIILQYINRKGSKK